MSYNVMAYLYLTDFIQFNLQDTIAMLRSCPPPQFQIRMGQNIDHGIFHHSYSRPSNKEKFHLINKKNSFEAPTLDSSQNVQSQIVSMGSACSFSSESDTHSITSDDQNFLHEESASVVIDRKRTGLGGCGSNESNISERVRSVVTPTKLAFKNRQCEKSFNTVSSQTSLCPSKSSLDSKASNIESVDQCIKRRRFQDWQGACRYALHSYDNTLPSLEEAAELFGFSGATDF